MKPPWWPLVVLVMLVPITLLGIDLLAIDLSPMGLCGLTGWVAFLFCCAHRLVYFYHVRQAPKWVYFVAMPFVLVMYPALFVCWMLVAAMQATVVN